MEKPLGPMLHQQKEQQPAINVLQQQKIQKKRKIRSEIPASQLPIQQLQSKIIIEQISKINGEQYTRTYEKISLLGKGGFALCFKTKQQQAQNFAATKIIKKSSLENYRTKLRLQNEIKLHKAFKHENVVKFYNNFEDEHNVYINLQLCQNGALVDLLRTRSVFSTPQIQSFMFGICQGVKYLHANKVIHRDLKLGNLFIDSQFVIKIGDFGLASKLQFTRQNKRTVCGTPNYLAPQVLLGIGYHFQVDIWAIGVIMYALFFSIPPFETDQAKTTYQMIKKCEFSFPKYHQAPPQALQLIKKILVKNPADRFTINQILESSFMRFGRTIPLGLPPIVIKRAPNKKQLKQWPCILVKSQENSSQKSFLGFILQKRNSKKQLTVTGSLFENEISVEKMADNIKTTTTRTVHALVLQQLEQNVLFYALSNGNYGIYQMKRSKSYCKNIFKPQQKNITVIQSHGSSLKSIDKNVVNEVDCQHRVIMNIKCKQLINMNIFNNRQIQDQNISLIKVNMFKDIKMVRLSNRHLQIVYPQQDSFLILSDRKCVQYYSAMCNYKPMDILDSLSILNSGNNGADKQNKTSIKLKKGNKMTSNKLNYLRMLLNELLTNKQWTACEKSTSC